MEVTSTRQVSLEAIQAAVVKCHKRIAFTERGRLRGLITDKAAVAEIISANMDLEVELAGLLNIAKWDSVPTRYEGKE